MPICGIVSQISPPIRILVIAVLGLLAAWMLVLRPDAEEPVATKPTPNVESGAPAVSKPGKVAQAAQDAANATNAQLKAEEELSGGDAKTAPAAKPAAKPAAAAPIKTSDGVDLTGVPRPAAKAIAKDKTLVLLFWSKGSSDDRVVRRELRQVDRWDGDVYVKALPIKAVSKYGKITRGADVAQSPTTLVIGRDLKVTPLVGYVDSDSIDQAVLDSMRNSGGYLKDPYLAKINEVCASVGRASFAVPDPDNAHQVGTFLASQKRVMRRLDARFAAVKAPKKWRGFKRATVRDHKMVASFFADWSAYVGTSPSRARVLSSLNKFSARDAALVKTGKAYNKRMDKQHVLSCGSDA